MKSDPDWIPFDPTWLVELVMAQLPEHAALAESLGQTTRHFPKSAGYWYFVAPTNANQPGAEWQFARNIHLDGGKLGPLVLDVLQDGRVGGVEFIARVDG